jgi:hypothetical protein
VKAMDNKIGEMVIFTKDLHCRFSSENIEQLKVYSFSKKEFDNCEDWSDDEKNHCFKVADFHVEINKEHSRFFFGEPILWGFYRHNPEKLHFLPVGTCPIPESFQVIGSDSFESFYKIPSSMWDFARFIDNFLFHIMGKIEELQNEYSQKMSTERHSVTIETENGLPF